MDLIDIGLILGIGILCGALGQFTSSYSRGGWVINLGIGIIGSALGVYISRAINAPEIYNLVFKNTRFPLIYSIVGSVLGVGLINILMKPQRM